VVVGIAERYVTENGMTNSVMARIERLVLALREMSEEIEPELRVISPVARQEWRALQGTWPSDSQLREGTPGLTEEQLETLVAKTRRFKSIVHGLAASFPRLRLRDDESPILER
jgi:hypothetical protein